ncbi:hypothetical protein MSKU15_3074 [Komagataeibacter diospyri]|uniref:autotransporter domain-containing protein n=1 Tax=Komagataeibacter diospyri TaxID=1932662 RepID=UPI001136CFA9|nr:autotransporter domain-containing protein [Komagataeibacter diospyri]GCE91473.1 hypothetical protein MSKU15_3074 [Komagataeibacter diospyri]
MHFQHLPDGRGWHFWSVLILLVSVGLVVTFRTSGGVAEDMYRAVVRNGVIDLQQWDARHTIPLDGEWQVFCRLDGAHLSLPSGDALVPDGTLRVPGLWNASSVCRQGNDNRPAGFGAITYRMVVHLPGNVPQLTLQIPQILSASRVWVDGHVVSQSGTPGLRAGNETPRTLLNQLVSIEPGHSTLTLAVEVSNHFHFEGGILGSVLVGAHDDLWQALEFRLVFDAGVLGALLILAFYIAAFGVTTHSRGWGWLLVLIIFLAARLGCTSGLLTRMFPSLSATFLYRLEYLTIYMSWPIYFRLLWEFFPGCLHRFAGRFIQVSAAMGCLLTILTPVALFTRFRDVSILFLICSAWYYTWCVVRAIRNKETSAEILGLGVVIFITCVLHDGMMYAHWWRYGTDLAPLGGLMLLFFHIIILGQRFVASLSHVRILSNDLALLNASLEAQVSERTQQIEQTLAELHRAKDRAENDARNKDRFLAHLSHEVRTPLNAIFGMTSLMLRDGPREDQRRRLELMRFEGAGLVRLLDDVLDMSSLETARIEIVHVPFNLENLCARFADVMVERCAEKGLGFTREFDFLPTAISGDPTRLHQLLGNVLDNALKFTKTGSVRFVVRAWRRGPGVWEVVFELTNTGPGIPPHVLNRVFDEFVRGPDTEFVPGSGLGLAIVSRLAVAMGGRVSLDNIEGGSRFTFTLPLREAGAIPVGTTQDALTPRAGLSVLLVEDTPENRLVMLEMLVPYGMNIVVAASGAEALSQLEDGYFDVMLLDMVLPDMPGEDVALNGASSYAGGTTIDGGNLSISSDSALGNTAGAITLTDNGSLETTADITTARNITLGTGGGEISPDAGTTLSVAAPVGGAGGLTMDGAGTLVLEGTNTYTGITTISSGTLELSGLGSIATSGGVVDNGTLDISGSSMWTNSITSLSGNGTVALGPEVLVLTDASGTFDGVIADGGVAGGASGNLNLQGGTETLTGVNTYTGETEISAGTLALAGSGSITASSQLLMDSGSVFDISGTSAGASVTSVSDVGGSIALGGNTLTLGAGARNVESPEIILAGGVVGDVVNVIVGPVVDGGISGGVGGGLTLTNPDPSGSVVATVMNGENTYTGATTIETGTALLLASGSMMGMLDDSPQQASIASSSRVVDNGILDISLNGILTSTGTDANGDVDDTEPTIATYSTAITSLAGNGVVALGSQNLLLTNASDTFSGTITDDSIFNEEMDAQGGTTGGSLTLAGGHETLTGVNTYTGGTTIEAGTLTGTTASFGSGAIVDNGTLDIDQSTDGTLANPVSGTGMLVKDGTGTLTLSQAEAYTGATTINAGALALSGDGSIATSGAVTINGGTFDISGTTNGTSITSLSGNTGGAVSLGEGTLTLTDAAGSFAGTISGTGGVTLVDGHETLTGNNTYAGGTTIEAGTLTGTTGSFGTGAIVDNGTLELSQSTDGTLTNAVSGTGALLVDGTGNMTLSGVNSYTGGTTLAAGVLTVANASALSTGALNMAQGTALNFGADGLVLANAVVLNGDPTVNVTSGQDTLSGVLSDGTSPGDLVKTGAGTLVLSGDSTYSGGTEIADGTLEVDGSIVSPVVADAGTTLAGTGTVGDTTIASGATLSPGNGGDAMGTMTVRGNLTMATGSNYVVNLSEDGAHDLVSVQGKATLEGGTVHGIAADGGWSTNVRYTILSATDGVTGKFSSVTSNLAFLTPTLTYDADDVYLLLGRNTVSFASVGDTRNERAVGGAMDTVSGGSLYNALVQTDATTARHALNGLSGELHASARTALIQDSYYIRDAAIERLRGADCERGAASGMKTASTNGQRTDGACRSEHAALWMQAYGSFGHNAGDGNASGMGHSVGGFVLGADAPVLGWHVGGLIGYGHSTFDSAGVSSYGHSSNVSLGGYAGTHWGRLALRMGATYTWDMLSMTRNVRFTGFSDRLSSRYNGGTAQAFGDLGYRLDAGPVGIEPFADIAYVNLHTDRFAEHGGSAALVGRAIDTGVTYSTFGARFSSSFHAGGVVLMPNAMLGYRHAFGLTTPTSREAFMSGGNAFEVAGVPLAQDTAVIKLGLRAKLSRVLDIGLSYIGQYGRRSVDSGLTGNIRVKF